MEDPIQSLLSTMGWSCEDLLKKLQQYKNDSTTGVKDNAEQDPESAEIHKNKNNMGKHVASETGAEIGLNNDVNPSQNKEENEKQIIANYFSSKIVDVSKNGNGISSQNGSDKEEDDNKFVRKVKDNINECANTSKNDNYEEGNETETNAQESALKTETTDDVSEVENCRQHEIDSEERNRDIFLKELTKDNTNRSVDVSRSEVCCDVKEKTDTQNTIVARRSGGCDNIEQGAASKPHIKDNDTDLHSAENGFGEEKSNKIIVELSSRGNTDACLSEESDKAQVNCMLIKRSCEGKTENAASIENLCEKSGKNEEGVITKGKCEESEEVRQKFDVPLGKTAEETQRKENIVQIDTEANQLRQEPTEVQQGTISVVIEEELLEDAHEQGAKNIIKSDEIKDDIEDVMPELLKHSVNESKQTVLSKEEGISERIPSAYIEEKPSTSKEIHCSVEKEFENGEEDDEPEPEPRKDEEEVRNLLRMQILQLRNKKKVDVISSTVDKNILSRTIPESKKKKRKVSSDNEKEVIAPKKPALEDDINKQQHLEGVLISNESDFLIVDVVGGYKSPEREETKPETKPQKDKMKIINQHLEGEPILLTKTKDYKDIKGWKNKKFTVPLIEEETPKCVPFFDEAVPSCSYTDTEKVEVTLHEPRKEDIKAAFESNLLDQFLVEHSRLNISYEVPKLDAEENITQNYDDLLIPVKACDVSLDKNQEIVEEKKQGETYKPKTLAEKRKMIERNERKKVKQDSVKEEDESSTTFTSRIYCKGKILKVQTRVRYGGFFYYITKRGATKGQPKRPRNSYVYVSPKPEKIKKINKPSLLTALKSEHLEKISYKPGPLSMKRKLQDHSSTNNWTTVIKKLPKITLEVTPEYGVPLDPRIVDLIKYDDTILTEERIDFALTAVKTDEKSTKTFVFPVAYRNDEKFILMRKRLPQTPLEEVPEMKVEDDETAVKTVIDKLLNYVEVAAVADTFIKADTEERSTEESSSVKPLTPISKNIDAIIKNSRKRKTSLELKRLNVKIIDVDVAEKEDNGTCTKPYCRMGCVCKSLECSKSYNFHCGKEECMLECSCNYNKTKQTDEKVILPAGTNILSFGTVSHLQNQAKRNLAKVEKEFVQTVIQSNDQTIILGTGNRDRQRRATKLPRKMNDYIGDEILNNIDDAKEEKGPVVQEEKPKKVETGGRKKWVVKLHRLDLEDVVPFCLVHNLHDCHCGYEAKYTAPDKTISKTKEEQQELETKRTTEEENEEDKLEEKQAPKPVRILLKRKYKKRSLPEEEPKETERESSPVHCSRTMEVATRAYRVRNSTMGYLDRLRKTLALKEKRMAEKNPPSSSTKTLSIPLPSLSKQHRRKQNIEIRRELAQTIDLSACDNGLEIISVPPEKAMQRRKKKVSIGGNSSSTEIVCMPSLIDYKTSKQEMLSPTPLLTEEFVRYLGSGNKKFQLLPWDVLTRRYKDGSLQVWCNLKVKRVLITDNRIQPTRNYTNVNFLQYSLPNKEQMDIDTIRWLITDKVPRNRSAKDVLLVLRFKQTCWEVCGICERNPSTSEEDVSLSLINTDLNEQQAEDEANEQGFDQALVHKTMNNELAHVPLIREDHERRVLMYQPNCEGMSAKQLQAMSVPLPEINEEQRWCMVSLTSKFSYLAFPCINYSINLTNLRDLVTFAWGAQQTLVLESKFFNTEDPEKFKHNIYVVPNFQDRIFIGPYGRTEESKVETFDYVNSVLVNTDLYRKMKGEITHTCIWLIQVPNAPSTKQQSLLKDGLKIQVKKQTPDLVVIDDDSENEAVPENKSSSSDDDDVVLVKDKEYLEEGDLKRYFVTNVQGLGYIEAYQFTDSKIVDVKWPFTNNIQRYSKEEDAVVGVQRQLHVYLIPIPKDFEIEVLMVTEVPAMMMPMSQDYAQRHYAVGEFGVCNLLTPKASSLCGLPQEEIVELVLERSNKILLQHCMKLTKVFMASNRAMNYDKPEEILTGALKEIKYQEQMYDSLNKSKIALEMKTVELLKECFKLMKTLPPDEEKKVRQRLHTIIHKKQSPSSKAKADEKSEDEAVLIEISDDENEKEKLRLPTEDLDITPIEISVSQNQPTGKIVPALIKIKSGNLSATKKYIQTKKELPSSTKKLHRKPILTPRKNLLKLTMKRGFETAQTQSTKVLLSRRDSLDSDIIKRLKMNSGLQVSVLSQEVPATARTDSLPAVQMQKCEISRIVKEPAGASLQCVSKKQKLSKVEIQRLVSKSGMMIVESNDL